MNKFQKVLLCTALYLPLTQQAQDIKSLDYAAKYKQQKVRERNCYEVRYQGNQAMDSVLIGTAIFDNSGRITSYTECYARGKRMAEHSFGYDASGNMNYSSVKLVFNDWQEMIFDLKYDAKGRVVERSLPEAPANYWQKESYTYSANGTLIKSEQWYNLNGTLTPQSKKEYPANIDPSDNSLTYIHDQNGLMIMHQLFGGSGKADKAWAYKYKHY